MAYARGTQVRETTVQGGGGNVGVGQGVHGGEVLCRDVATEGAKRRSRSTARARRAIAVRVYLTVQLIKVVLAIQRRCLVGGEIIRSLVSGLWCVIAEVVVLVNGKVWRDVDRDG